MTLGEVTSITVCFIQGFTSDFGKLRVPLHLGKDKYFFHDIWENIYKIGKNKVIFWIGNATCNRR